MNVYLDRGDLQVIYQALLQYREQTDVNSPEAQQVDLTLAKFAEIDRNSSERV